MRQVPWGDALMLEAVKYPGGLTAVTEVIASVVGSHIGTRPTLAKLYGVQSPGQIRPRDRFRAWLMLATVGQEPTEWGVGDDVVPLVFEPDGLKIALRAQAGSGGQR